ncbi:hypothetical protein ACLESD_00905 [Pyxidicoccus sp. 3LFB2]
MNTLKGLVHLYCQCTAVLQYLHEKRPAVRLAVEPRTVFLRSGDVLPALQKLQGNTDIELHGFLDHAVQSLAFRISLWGAGVRLPPHVDLEPIHDGDTQAVFGRVFCWLQPHSFWAELQDRRRRGCESPPLLYPPEPMQRVLEGIALYQPRSHRRYVPSRQPFNALCEALGYLLTTGHLKFGLFPMQGKFRPLFELIQGGRRFVVDRGTPMREKEALAEHVDGLVRECGVHKVHLGVLPEMMVPPELRGVVSRALQQHRPRELLGLFAGSGHDWAGRSEGLPVNQGELLDSSGRVWMVQQKGGLFRVTRAQVLGSPGDFSHLPAQLPQEIHEGIIPATESSFLCTSIGRIAWVICADVLDPVYRQRILDLRPDFVFISAMSRKTEEFRNFAEQLLRQGGSTFFVNAGSMLPGDASADLAFAFLALPELPGGNLPTRFRWSNGEKHIRYYRPSKNDWPFMEARQQGAWLTQNGAMVVDVGVHWTPGPP